MSYLRKIGLLHSKAIQQRIVSYMAGKNVEDLSGLEARLMIRKGEAKRTSTAGWCKEFKQANVVILPKIYADDFSKFCEYNSGPLPVIYESKPGEKGCAIADDSDITTDLPAYKIWKNGELEEIVDEVTGYDWSDMVTFYTGCSFSFDGMLLGNGIPIRNIEQKKQIAMYKCNVPCYRVGPFHTNMVVSMRPIPEHQLSLAADITSQMEDVHGAPIHIGDPSVILGDEKFEDTDFGEFAVPQKGDIPVFWACGVTNSQALREARCPLAITHHPGMMYFSDTLQSEYDPTKGESEKCIVTKYSEKGPRFSILSIASQKALTELETVVADDPGHRGIEHLLVKGDFEKAALALSHGSSVALITGFPVHDSSPPDENDGLPGIYSLAAMLQALNIRVTLIVDYSGYGLNQSIIKKQVAAGILREGIEVVSYLDSAGKKHELLNESGKPKYDVVLASERAGRSSNGKYFSMKGKDVSDRVDPIDNLFEEAGLRHDVTSIGIGDGGNELGMGKVYQHVKTSNPLGEKIACEVPADLLIAGGTSNWGCQALAVALFALRKCQIHERYQRRAVGPVSDVNEILSWALPTIEREREILEIVEDAGIRDGVKPDQKMSVDGMYFEEIHAKKITEMRNAIGLETL